ncbi:ATP-binding protein [Hyphomicrobium sp. CS1BSMeth3]|uniref:ATP-binding protein n=1 Tax=Hyphomicrobium sp. CS1BSMeth3 TaxID=1892844 RepID=UPI0009311847|nr:ATP-binding protein [Hyphomicrobium sp. CS1BSMeth3]
MAKKPTPFGALAGPPVSGPAFFDRETELAALDRAITTGGKVLLVGPRRSGKTSLLHQARRRLGEAGATRNPLHLDLSGASARASAVRILALAAQQAPHAREVAAATPEAELLAALQAALRHRVAEGPGRLVLFIDEIGAPLAPDDAERQLWRNLIAALADIAGLTVIASLDTRVFDALGAPKGFDIIRIKPWDADVVRRAATAWARAERMPSELVDAIVERLSPAWPMELMRLLLEIPRNGPPTERALDALIDRQARDISYEEAVQRLATTTLRKRDEHLIRLILSALADRKDGATPEAVAQSAVEQKAQPSDILRLARWLANLDLISLDAKSHRMRAPTALAWHSLRRGLGLQDKTA